MLSSGALTKSKRGKALEMAQNTRAIPTPIKDDGSSLLETPSYYDPADPLLTPRDVARRLGIHRETVYEWMRKGIILYVEIGQGRQRPRKRIRESEVVRQLREPSSAA